MPARVTYPSSYRQSLNMLTASIILYIITIFALAYFAWMLNEAFANLGAIIHDTMETEVRRQDERIEKRRQRAADPVEDEAGTAPGQERIVSGRPTNRRGS